MRVEEEQHYSQLTLSGSTESRGSEGMNKSELETLLEELDEALAKAFPGPEPMSVLVVRGACLLCQGATTRPTEDRDVIILEMMGSEENTLLFHDPIADTIRRSMH